MWVFLWHLVLVCGVVMGLFGLLHLSLGCVVAWRQWRER